MTIIVTGASGNFGRSAIEKLLQKVPANELILVSRNPKNLTEFALKGCTIRQGDYDFPEGLPQAYAGGDKMLMISGTRVGKRYNQHKAAIDGAKAAGVKHIIYTSFIGATPENPSEAVGDHIATEKMLRESGLNWTALRNSQYADAVVEVMSPPAIASGKWISAAGEGFEAPVWREDCVASAVAVLTTEGHENQIYNITGSERWNQPQMCAYASQLSGKPIEFVGVDKDGMYAYFDRMGVPREPVDDLVANGFPWNSDDMVSFEIAWRDGHFDIISDDVEKLTGRKAHGLKELFDNHAQMLRAI